MGDVATAAAADQHLVQGLAGGLQQTDIAHPRFGGGDGSHEARRSTPRHHHGGFAKRHG